MLLFPVNLTNLSLNGIHTCMTIWNVVVAYRDHLPGGTQHFLSARIIIIFCPLIYDDWWGKHLIPMTEVVQEINSLLYFIRIEVS